MAVPMEESVTDQQVISGGSTGSINVSLHPLVVMNVSDHFTRVRVQDNPTDTRGIDRYI